MSSSDSLQNTWRLTATYSPCLARVRNAQEAVFRKKLIVLGFRIFMPPLFPVDITDGLVEAKNSSAKEFGVERVRQILESKHDLRPGRFVDALLYGLSGWSEDAIGSSQSDDITLLVIDFEASAQQSQFENYSAKRSGCPSMLLARRP